jgi:alanine racemase
LTRPSSSEPPADGEQQAEEQIAAAILTIDLGAIARNWRRLSDLCAAAECAAVVKADAYGLGMRQVAQVLAAIGCKTFFVATLSEGGELRALLPDATIYVFNGLLPGTADFLRQQELRPVLNSLDEVSDWGAFCREKEQRLPAALHLDTGMNRLGLAHDEVDALAARGELFDAFAPDLVISHLACADDADHPKSATQRRLFDEARRKLPEARASLANSAGIMLGADYHYDLARPGIALYGGKPQRGEAAFEPVVTLRARVLQVREALAGETIGYGATRTLQRAARIATLACGYADGLFRALSVGDGSEGLCVYFGDRRAPLLGRVSMDVIAVDVTDIPPEIAHRGAFAEIIGRNAAHAIAEAAGTIDYEVLTNLGRRALRRYIGP